MFELKIKNKKNIEKLNLSHRKKKQISPWATHPLIQ